MIIYINQDKEYPCCPLRTDLNNCGVIDRSPINSCPSLSEDGGKWELPSWCPLKSGDVLVKLEKS